MFFIPFKLGRARRFDPTIFPFMKVVPSDNALGIASLALECTLDEILKIRDMVADKKKYQVLVADAKIAYDQYVVSLHTCSSQRADLSLARLCIKRDQLAGQQKSINPLKLFSTYRSTKLLLEAGTLLYRKTKVIIQFPMNV
jgi:hypothetical protein